MTEGVDPLAWTRSSQMSQLERIANALEGILAALQQQPTDVPLMVQVPNRHHSFVVDASMPHYVGPEYCSRCMLPASNQIHDSNVEAGG